MGLFVDIWSLEKNIFTYNKKEKLKSRKQLQVLFSSGHTLLHFPVKVFYTLAATPLDNRIKAGVGASSRQYKKAVQRNRIKRLLREAYRLNKGPLHQFLAQHNQQLVVFFLYIDKQLPQPGVLHAKMPAVLNKLIEQLGSKLQAVSNQGLHNSP